MSKKIQELGIWSSRAPFIVPEDSAYRAAVKCREEMKDSLEINQHFFGNGKMTEEKPLQIKNCQSGEMDVNQT